VSHLLDTAPADRPGPAHRRRTPKIVGVLVITLVVIVLMVAVAFGASKVRNHFRSAPDYSGSGTGRAVVQVKAGDSAYNLATRLADMGIVKSAAAFRKAAADNSEASKLQPGYYELHEQMSAAAALALLLDPKARLRGHVTIPEGSTENQTLALIAKNSEIPLADLKQAAGNPAALGLPAYAQGHLEGFLFPATYDIEPGTGAVQVLTMMVDRFEESAAANGLVERSKVLGLTPYQIVIVASLIERESRLKEEYPKVSRVVYNRLKKNMTLGIDASILYGLGRTSGGLKKSELAKDTPYNTRLHTGLPPTPIASPGDAALEGALQPATGDWLYYVLADKNGRQLFTSNYQEFLRQKAKSQAEGIF
jgi:UPF0755 protein